MPSKLQPNDEPANPQPRLRDRISSIGPALIVAAVVLGPGSILTSSRVGANIGPVGLLAIAMATVLMIGMVMLAVRIGVGLRETPGEAIARHVGRGPALLIGLVVFAIVALFQSSNNVALVAGLEPMVGAQWSFSAKLGIAAAANLLIVACLYTLPDLYRRVESSMKVLIGVTALAFVCNAVFVAARPQPKLATKATAAEETGKKGAKSNAATNVPATSFALIGMIATTFSVAGAFYQAYLVRERGWTLADLPRANTDAIISIGGLGLVTSIVLLTSYKVFFGTELATKLDSVADVASQLEPLFGAAARMIFAAGILGGALSSFLVNAMVGGTVLSDCAGWGARLDQRAPRHLTTLALGIGGLIAAFSMANKESTVGLITLAQALTVIGIPALAICMLYLGSLTEVRRNLSWPLWILCGTATITSILLATITVSKLIG